MSTQSTRRRFIVCLSICIVLTPLRTEAGPPNPSVTVSVGQPNVWSLAQAHYLLAQMRESNRGLQVPPVSAYLDPNAANGTRMDILRTFFGADFQYSQVAGTQNRAVLQKFEDESNRRRLVQRQLDELMPRYLKAVHLHSEMGSQLATLSATDPAVEQQRKELTAAIALKKAEVDTLNAQMTALNTQLTQAPTLGSLNSTAPFNQDLPGSNEKDLDDILDKVITKIAENTTPKLGASIALDNYVQMQYELIAKQLTLLRDEVRPGERLVFLELPSDIYTVPKVDDDYVVQVEWSVSKYFGRQDSGMSRERLDGPRQAEPLSMADIHLFTTYKSSKPQQFAELLKLSSQYRALSEERGNSRAQEKRIQELPSEERELFRVISGHPEIIELDWMSAASNPKDPAKFRVIDIIPRQSALNVNDVQAQTKGFAFAARFLSIFGLGGQVSYQRQRTLYGQFMQQEVFASGYGKGQGRFGWTFGALPGTKRIAPGVRTTYAILSIPDYCLAIELQPITRVYKRTDAPTDVRPQTPDVQPSPQRVLIPGDQTQGFWIDRIRYTPVQKGERVTVILRGRSFSPLTGILVDGVPLKRAVSIAKNEGDSTTLRSAVDSFGEYEYLNSNQIIMSFKLPDQSYVGTPAITLVTPEKTHVINRFELTVNGTNRTTLDNMRSREPMFLDQFSFTGVAQVGGAQSSASIANRLSSESGARELGLGVGFDAHTVSAPQAHVRPAGKEVVRLVGTGFRQGAEIWVEDESGSRTKGEITEITTNEIIARIPAPSAGFPNARRIITYRDGIHHVVRYYEPSAPSIEAIENPSTGKPEGPADGGYVVTIRGSNFNQVDTVLFGQVPARIEQPRDTRVLFVRVPPGEEGAVQVLINSKDKNKTNIADFGTAGKAIYRYTAAKPKTSSEPSITEIENPDTGKPEGFTRVEAEVTIRGRNLENVQRVRFGSIDARIQQRGGNVLLVKTPPVGEAMGVQVFVETAPGADGKTLNNLHDFQVAGKAIYRFVLKPASPGEAASRDGRRRAPPTRRARDGKAVTPRNP